MAKTIRSHPTSHILVLEPIFGDYFYIFKIWTQNGPTFSSFSNLATGRNMIIWCVETREVLIRKLLDRCPQDPTCEK